jgi:hypothetical protein
MAYQWGNNWQRPMQQPAQGQQPAQQPVQQPAQQPQQGQQSYNPYNPYLANQMASTVQDYSRQFLEQVNPALQGQAILAGGYGGDRANLAKSTAASNMQRDISGAIAGMQSGDWQAGQQFGLNQQAHRLARHGGIALDPQDLPVMGQRLDPGGQRRLGKARANRRSDIGRSRSHRHLAHGTIGQADLEQFGHH